MKCSARSCPARHIDATTWSKPLRKNLGKKNCELSAEDVQHICDAFLAFEETEQSKRFPNAAFGYWKVTVERPLRLRVDLNESTLRRFRIACLEAKEEPLANLMEKLAEAHGEGPFTDYNAFMAKVKTLADAEGVKLTAKREKLLQGSLAQRDEAAAPVIRKLHKPGKVTANPLHGRYAIEVKGKPGLVEFEPDSELRDTEQIPLLEEGGIEAFIRREVLPHAADAWVDEEATKIGYEISFNRYFYKPQPMRSLEDIRADILALEKETEGMLAEIVGSAKR